MPTPAGHVLAGLTIAWAADAVWPRLVRVRTSVPGSTGLVPDDRAPLLGGLAVLSAFVALAPDFDILLGSHRTVSHSLTSAIVAGIAAALVARIAGVPAWRPAIVCGLAWASHVLLDWLGKDSSAPQGIMALWPFSQAYYVSGMDLFSEVSRRYWLPEQFIVGNLRSMARELVILSPAALVAWFARRRRFQ